MICYAKDCHCGEPIEIRTIDGRRVPIHVNRGKRRKRTA